MKHCYNHDEMKTENRMCVCGHKRYEHEAFPDEHCYKCSCQAFRWKRKKNNKVIEYKEELA